MRLAILGGTFNPFHIAHAMLCDLAVTELGYDRVHVIPTFVPSHKQLGSGLSNVPAEHRLGMVRAFCSLDSRFVADDTEIARGGISYTYDTICALLKKHGDQIEGKIGFFMGQETAGEFDKWRHAEKLEDLMDIIVAKRHPDWASVADSGEFLSEKNAPVGGYTGKFATDEELAALKFRHLVLDNVLLPLSSTEIRMRVAAGKSFRYLVPGPVFEYIEKNGLYGRGAGGLG